MNKEFKSYNSQKFDQKLIPSNTFQNSLNYITNSIKNINLSKKDECARVEEPKDGSASVSIVLGNASKGTLDRLGGVLYFGFRSVKLRVYGAKEAAEQCTSGASNTPAPSVASTIPTTAPVEEVAKDLGQDLPPESPLALSEMGELAAGLFSATLSEGTREGSEDEEADITVVEAAASPSRDAEGAAD